MKPRGAILLLAAMLLMAACSTTRSLGEGEKLLRRANIKIEHDGDDEAPKASELKNFLRQKPNSRALGFLPLRLYTYNWSGTDTTRFANRWLRRVGEPPVVFSPELTSRSASQLQLAMINRGYLNAQVEVDTASRGRKTDVTYRITPHEPYRIASIEREVPDSALRKIIRADSANYTISAGALLDRNKLDAERSRITELLRRNGYYAFVRDNITFTADTLASSTNVALTMYVNPPKEGDAHRLYTIDNVIFEAEEGEPLFLSDQTMRDNCFIVAGKPYNAEQFNRTYEALGRLGIIKSVKIELRPTTPDRMDAIIKLRRNQRQGVSVELEGTNSEGDLGVGVGVTYQHRNIFRSSELLTIKGRGSYESLSGNLEGLINNHYTEASAEVALTFPNFRAPFVSRNYRRKVLASTEFSLSGNYQERPEYTRVIAGAGWRYKWNDRNHTFRRVFDLVDINYVFLPRSTINFLDEVAAGNPLLRYSYEDHFIMRMGYSLFLTNKPSGIGLLPDAAARRSVRNVWTLRTSAESAGNLLYIISKAVGMHKRQGAYKIFGTQYAQYVKGELDFMVKCTLTHRAALAFHMGAGVAVPYGNSSMVPFEKRFYAGGANSVRGWSVRTLGPGRYDARNSVTDFINQCGDIRLDLNIEARMKLFWVVEGAAFIDAGNVWTIRKYDTQPGGEFSFRSFYKELGWAYGLGLRLDFTYFLLRFDLGMKAYNPAMNQEPWPLVHPDWHRDATFHFSVGYPF